MPPRSPALAPILRAQPDAVAALFAAIEAHNGGRGALSKLAAEIAPTLKRKPDVLARSMREWRAGRVAPTFAALGSVYRALCALGALPSPSADTQALLALLGEKFPPPAPEWALQAWAGEVGKQAKARVAALEAAGRTRAEAKEAVRTALFGALLQPDVLKTDL